MEREVEKGHVRKSDTLRIEVTVESRGCSEVICSLETNTETVNCREEEGRDKERPGEKRGIKRRLGFRRGGGWSGSGRRRSRS